ncbi:MAG: hypothetical protein K9L32_00060 [Chromatiaceae bacterium]|nr:hypothetical protein [Chromatiaceae bacterium]MCF8002599.1 hypothetical protein [Chromatiaceae bacterium]
MALIALLATAAALQWRDWPPAPPPVSSTDSFQPAAAPLQPPPVLDTDRTRDDYLTIVERPLFRPDRRPQPDDPVAEAGLEEEGAAAEALRNTDINAILIKSPDPPSVWLIDPMRRNELIRRRLGEDYQGWIITAIEPDQVRFERQGQTETLNLNDFLTAPQRRTPPVQRPVVPLRGPASVPTPNNSRTK